MGVLGGFDFPPTVSIGNVPGSSEDVGSNPRPLQLAITIDSGSGDSLATLDTLFDATKIQRGSA